MTDFNNKSLRKYLELRLSQFESQILSEVLCNIPCIPGRNGNNGAKGDPGQSFITGTGSPTSNIGANGDTYLDVTTDNLYVKVNNNWILVDNIKGDKGDKGENIDVDTSGIISFGGIDVRPSSPMPPLPIITRFLVPYNRIGSSIVSTGDTITSPNLITLTLPLTIPRTAQNPVVTVGINSTSLDQYGDLTFTLGTLTNDIVPFTSIFTPSTVSIFIPNNALSLGILTFSNNTSAIFSPGDRLTVRVYSTNPDPIPIGMTAQFNFELV